KRENESARHKIAPFVSVWVLWVGGRLRRSVAAAAVTMIAAVAGTMAREPVVVFDSLFGGENLFGAGDGIIKVFLHLAIEGAGLLLVFGHHVVIACLLVRRDQRDNCLIALGAKLISA